MSANILSTAWEYLSHYIPFLDSIRHSNEPLLPVAHEKMTRTRLQDRAPPGPRGRVECGRIPALSTTDRAVYSKHGCTVYGWPSTGGVIVRSNCDMVELRYLGWDPLEAPESRNMDQEQEDAFCAKLRMIGGRWWSSRRRFHDVMEKELSPTDDEWREVYIGWPERGGVLIPDDWTDAIPFEIGMLRLVTTMEERCRLLRDKLDAVYYENPMKYPGFAVLGLGKIEG